MFQKALTLFQKCAIIHTERGNTLSHRTKGNKKMTKQEANEIKKAIKGYTVYFQSKTGKLRVRVYTYINDAYDKECEHKRIVELLNRVSKNGYRPKYEIDHKTYQCFIHDTDIVFQ